ncbi:MAG TPA: RNA polymerase sigma factor [Pirellulaceae bacterium]|jgi:RNA polymerase sigma-70 factor (ECF subfamily)|nr:RNA polymerase sigma factor [Pirellulaceae bacterium]
MDATLHALTTTHRHWLRTALFARLQNADAVDEVMQELAVVALRASSPVRDESRIGPWLYRVAVRQALLYRRSRGRSRKTENGFRAELDRRDEEAATYADPHSLAISVERTERVRGEVAALPRRDREILMLKYAEDLSYREIGDRLGLSVSAVEARLHRARMRLRTKLRDCVETP